MATATRPATDSASSLRTLQDVHADSDVVAPPPGAAAAQRAQHSANAPSRSSARNGGGLKFGFLDLGGLQHCLRLRKSFAVTDVLSGEVGLDYNLNTRAAVPQYSLAYQARPSRESCTCAYQHVAALGGPGSKHCARLVEAALVLLHNSCLIECKTMRPIHSGWCGDKPHVFAR